MTASTFMPVIETKAASYSAYSTVSIRKVIGDGVRLRKEGWSQGTVLELMYRGEKVYFYDDILGSDPEYNYMRRDSTKTYGYVDHHYVR
ncbi:MAG: hypothetical protein IJN54_11530 [Lachnospiraceae bacterium]|nr:hypothetical protein [Lachnospiraceae bacterium]